MLHLDQINILNSDELIVEVLEPIVYTKVGSVEKTDAIISRDKDNAFYLIAKVVKASKVKDETSKDIIYTPGMYVMVTQPSLAVINFPIVGYDKPSLAVLNSSTIFAIIDEADLDKYNTENPIIDKTVYKD